MGKSKDQKRKGKLKKRAQSLRKQEQQRYRVLLKLDDGSWDQVIPAGSPAAIVGYRDTLRYRALLRENGLTRESARELAKELIAPVSGYEHLGTDRFDSSAIYGYGLPSDEVKIVKAEAWTCHEKAEATDHLQSCPTNTTA